MSCTPVLANSPTPNTKHVKEERRSANYHPSIWGDHFLQYARDDDSADLRRSEQRLTIMGLVTEVKVMLETNDGGDFLGKLDLIDQLQRLGVAYLFEPQIAERLEKMYENSRTHFEMCCDDLQATALLFRLLRQQGYPISCEVINKFKHGSRFRESLLSDLHGLLSLYQASHFMIHGEDILEEALAFTTTHLESIVKIKSCSGDDLLVKQVRHALKQPMRKGLPRIEARRYIPIYKEDPTRNNVLYSLAVLDFNSLQEQHQQELGSISRWWKDLDFARKLPFARDRVVECYFWILGVYFEPEFALARRIVTKVIAMTSVMDDIYDVYGTKEELQIFTQAIGRWDRGAVEKLPEYMKWFYNALLDVYDEIYVEMTNRGQTYRHDYAIEAMKIQAEAYFEEARWYHQGYVPSMKEYMRIAMTTSGYQMLLTVSFVCMGDVATEQAFKWIAEHPKMVRASELICRLMDDMASHKFEQKRGHLVSAVECYMKEHEDVSEEEAKKELHVRVFDAWKDINKECLHPTPVPMPLIIRILNFTSVMDVLYKDKDNYTNAGTKLKGLVKSMLVEQLMM